MIEIREEDIQSFDGCAHLIISTNHDCDYFEQLKQQILQDHKDAKKYRNLVREGYLPIINQDSVKIMLDADKNRQIVKRLEEQVKYFTLELASIGKPKREGDTYYIVHYEINRILQKILEAEK